QVTVIFPTQANAGNGFSICANASPVNLNSLNPTPAGGTWSGNGVTGNLFSPTSLNGIQILTYTFGTGTCLTTDTVHITVNPLPTVTVNSPAFCIGSSSTLIANGATTYLWTPSIGLSATIGSSVTSNPVVTTTYTVTGINSATGCGNSATSIVTVNLLPVVNAGSDQNFCNANTLIPLNGTPTGGTWSGTGVTGNNFNPGTAGVGNWTLTYSYTNSNGCSNSDQVLMTVINPTQANAGTGFNICVDADSINLNLLNPTPSGGTWIGNGVAANIFSPISLNGLQILTYSFGSGFCLTTDTIHVTVNSLPIVTVNFSSSICIGDSVTLTAGGATTYLWNPSIGLSDTTGEIVNASPSDTITYSVIGTTIYGCTSENFSLITVIDLNNPISATGAVVCENGEATISAIPSVNGNTILWYTDSIGGTSLFEGLSYTSFFDSLIVFYASTFNYLTGCESQERLPVLVSVYPLPQIEINLTDAAYGNNGAINATVTNGHPAYTFDWSNDGTGDFDDSSFISGLTAGNYSLTVSDQQGCSNDIDVTIANGEEILIPTGISPNGDGINDTWEIPGSYQYDDLVVSIFNLQGQLLYNQNKNYIPWNGKYNGELVPVGDYYFVIESLSHKKKETGTLTVKY
ncbi:MAG: gliding motility-associated C-terminal domain-containing protein, partial [Bacteroidota bacterium]